MTPKEETVRSIGATPDAIEQDIMQIRADLGATLDAIQHKLSPGQIMDQAVHYLEDGPGDYLVSLGAVVKRNPVPVALVGIGLAWLMVASRRSGAEPAEASLAAPAGEAVTPLKEHEAEPGGEDRPQVAVHRAARAAQTIRETVRHLGDTARAAQSIRETVRHLGESARGVPEQAAETQEGAGGRLRQAARGMSSRIRTMASGARHGMVSVGTTTRTFASRVGDGAVATTRERPLLVAGLALTAGAALGALLPASRFERETLQPKTESLRRQARHAVLAELDLAKDWAGEREGRHA
ncbi:MAG: DUF3618 domain-containing protein [Alphaproteobacteria bacterium]